MSDLEFATRLKNVVRREVDEAELERARVTLQAWSAVACALPLGTVQAQFTRAFLTGASGDELEMAAAHPLDVEIQFLVRDEGNPSFRFNLRAAFLREMDPEHGVDPYSKYGGSCDWTPVADALEQLAQEMRRVAVVSENEDGDE